MYSCLTISFATLCLLFPLLIFQAPTTAAKHMQRDRHTRRRAWCEEPHNRMDDPYYTLEYLVSSATRRCCKTILFNWAHYDSNLRMCHSQGGYADRGINWRLRTSFTLTTWTCWRRRPAMTLLSGLDGAGGGLFSFTVRSRCPYHLRHLSRQREASDLNAFIERMGRDGCSSSEAFHLTNQALETSMRFFTVLTIE
jgi:hypothetical protein